MFSKLRVRLEKPHSAKPYDRQKNLIRNVTKRVSDFIPSWLHFSSWINGQTEHQKKPRRDRVTLLTGLPSAGDKKRSLYRDTSAVPTSDPACFTGSTPKRPDFTSKKQLTFEDNHSSHSETSVSTSGCSSLAPSQERKRRVPSASKRHLESLPQQPVGRPPLSEPDWQISSVLPLHLVPTNTSKSVIVNGLASAERNVTSVKRASEESHCAIRLSDTDGESSSTCASLWSENDERRKVSKKKKRCVSRPEPVASNKRPCHRVSPYGTSITISPSSQEKSLEPWLSPFYPGRTRYGGASAQKKHDVRTSYNNDLRMKTASGLPCGSMEKESSVAKKILNIIKNVSPSPTESIGPQGRLSLGTAQSPAVHLESGSETGAMTSELLSSTAQKETALLLPLQHKPLPTLPVSVSNTPVSRIQADGTARRIVGAIGRRVSQPLGPSKKQSASMEEAQAQPDLPEVSLLPPDSFQPYRISLPGATGKPIVQADPRETEDSPLCPSTSSDVITLVKTPTPECFLFSSPIEKVPGHALILDKGESWKESIFQFRSPVYRSGLDCHNKNNDAKESFTGATFGQHLMHDSPGVPALLSANGTQRSLTISTGFNSANRRGSEKSSKNSMGFKCGPLYNKPPIPTTDSMFKKDSWSEPGFQFSSGSSSPISGGLEHKVVSGLCEIKTDRISALPLPITRTVARGGSPLRITGPSDSLSEICCSAQKKATECNVDSSGGSEANLLSTSTGVERTIASSTKDSGDKIRVNIGPTVSAVPLTAVQFSFKNNANGITGKATHDGSTNPVTSLSPASPSGKAIASSAFTTGQFQQPLPAFSFGAAAASLVKSSNSGSVRAPSKPAFSFALPPNAGASASPRTVASIQQSSLSAVASTEPFPLGNNSQTANVTFPSAGQSNDNSTLETTQAEASKSKQLLFGACFPQPLSSSSQFVLGSSGSVGASRENSCDNFLMDSGSESGNTESSAQFTFQSGSFSINFHTASNSEQGQIRKPLRRGSFKKN